MSLKYNGDALRAKATRAIIRAEKLSATGLEPPTVGWYVRHATGGGLWSPEIFTLTGLEIAERAPVPEVFYGSCVVLTA